MMLGAFIGAFDEQAREGQVFHCWDWVPLLNAFVGLGVSDRYVLKHFTREPV